MFTHCAMWRVTPGVNTMATQTEIDAKFSNSRAAQAEVDKAIADCGRRDGDGELARCDFLAITAKAFLEKTLAHTMPKKPGAAITETHHAEHALAVWSLARAKKLGMVRPVKSSRVAELAAIYKAAPHRHDIVEATVRVAAKLADETANTDEPFKGRTYDLIVKMAREQIRIGKVAGKSTPITDEEIRAVLLEKKDAPTE